MVEIGENCTRDWRRRNPGRRGVKLVTGDQTDVNLLARLQTLTLTLAPDLDLALALLLPLAKLAHEEA